MHPSKPWCGRREFRPRLAGNGRSPAKVFAESKALPSAYLFALQASEVYDPGLEMIGNIDELFISIQSFSVVVPSDFNVQVYRDQYRDLTPLPRLLFGQSRGRIPCMRFLPPKFESPQCGSEPCMPNLAPQCFTPSRSALSECATAKSIVTAIEEQAQCRGWLEDRTRLRQMRPKLSARILWCSYHIPVSGIS